LVRRLYLILYYQIIIYLRVIRISKSIQVITIKITSCYTALIVGQLLQTYFNDFHNQFLVMLRRILRSAAGSDFGLDFSCRLAVSDTHLNISIADTYNTIQQSCDRLRNYYVTPRI